MPFPGDERRLAAIMFTDMVGYSALTHRNEALALELLEEQRQSLRSCFPEFNGREVETTGDGFLVEFASALDATRCAIKIQKSLAHRNKVELEERRILVRIGIHVGDILHRDGRVMGDGVNIASRIEPLAAPGGICLSRTVFDHLHKKLEIPVVSMGTHRLKNIDLPVEVYAIALPWLEDPSLRVVGGESKPSRRLFLMAFLAATGLILMATWFTGARSRWLSPGDIRSLAVIPVQTPAGQTNQEDLLYGMADSLVNQLANIQSLHVKSLEAVRKHQLSGQRSSAEIGAVLNVDAVVEVSARFTANRLLIKANLIRNDQHLWGRDFTGDFSDVFRLQAELARQIAAQIKIKLKADGTARLASAGRHEPEALRLYFRALGAWGLYSSSGNDQAIQLLEEAIAIDKQFARAYAALSRAYARKAFSFSPDDALYRRADELVNIALALDENLFEAHLAKASLLWRPAPKDFPHTQAISVLRQALLLNASSDDAHLQLAAILAHVGLLDAALRQAETAWDLNPINYHAKMWVGVILLHRGEYEGALNEFEPIPAEFLPHQLARWKAWALFQLGNVGREKMRTLLDDVSAREIPDWGGTFASQRGMLFAAEGNAPAAEEQIQLALSHAGYGHLHHTIYFVACAYALLDQPEKAVQYLRQAAETGYPCYELFQRDPSLASVRGYPEFQSLMEALQSQYIGYRRLADQLY